MDKNKILKIYPLSPMQEGMLFHALLDKNSYNYFEQYIIPVKGNLQIEKFRKSFQTLIARYDIFRTVFISDKIREPRQVVLKEMDDDFRYKDIRELYEVEKEKFLADYIERDKEEGFDFARGKLNRITVVQKADDDYVLIWSTHHILMDGWCLGYIQDELLEIYSAEVQNRKLVLPEVKHYEEYIRWLQKRNQREADEYWDEYLAGFENVTKLPKIAGKEKTDEYKQEIQEICLSEKTTRKLQELANERKVTLYTIIKTVWGLLLQKYNNTDDIVFGNIVSGRPGEIDGIESMIGLFINALPVRVRIKEEKSFSELIIKVQEESLESDKYFYVPLAKIQSKTGAGRELIQCIMDYENFLVEDKIIKKGGDAHFVTEDIDSFEQTNYDMNVFCLPGERFRINIVYNANVYDCYMVKNLKGHFQNILEAVAGDPEIRLDRIGILSAEEKRQVLIEFNDNYRDYPSELSYIELFEEQVRKRPEAIAAVCGNERVTYKELNEQADAICRLLQDRSVGSNSVVGIFQERGILMLASILGIWKADAAYMPLDVSFPPERIRSLVGDSGACCVLTLGCYVNQELENVLTDKWLTLDNLPGETGKKGKAPVRNPESLRYVLYTSGSTGKPKGVMVHNQGFLNHLWGMINELSMSEKSILAQNASHCFDISVWQFVTALAVGGRVVIYPRETVLEVNSFIDSIKSEGVTILEVVPSYLSSMLDCLDNRFREFGELEFLLVTGEEFYGKLIERWFSKYRICMVNAYGPAEASDDITLYKITEPVKLSRVPIGKPLQNCKIYITDNNMNLCPVGVAGEICVGGVCVGKGYINDKERTEQSFIQDPFSQEKGGRLYKTGDLGRWTAEGVLEFHGRKDYQVKVRGYRIELGEIESQLLKNRKIAEAVVIDRKDENKNIYLAAYYVVKEQGRIEKEDVIKHLAEHLPSYMIPSYFVPMERLPVNASGKIDRKALPEVAASMLISKYTAPENELEKILCRIWQEVLKIEQVGVNDNFFEIGGHSLRAMNVIALIHKELNVELQLKTLFNKQTIKELAEEIAEIGSGGYERIGKIDEKEYYEVSSAQKRLYIVSQLEGAVTTYNMPDALEIAGALDRKKLRDAFHSLIARHESLRTSFAVIDEKIVQKVHKRVDFEIDYREMSEDAALLEVENFPRPFDLTTTPLLRAELIRTGADKYLLLFDMHHIISDGISMGIMIRELAMLYEKKTLPELTIQYKDYCAWQNQLLKSDRMKQQEEYWLKEYAGEIPVLELPYDYPRPAAQSFMGNCILFHINKEITDPFADMLRANGATMYMGLLAVYNILLHRYSGQEDIVVGSPVAGRNRSEFNDIIGMFVNTLAIRTQPEGKKKFKDYLKEVKEKALKAFENQDYQFEELVDKVLIRRDLGRNPLFDVMFVLQNQEEGEYELKGIKIKPFEADYRVAAFDLTLETVEMETGLYFSLEYCTKLFKKETIGQLALHFQRILEAVAREPEIELDRIEIMSTEEKRQLLVNFNDTRADYPKEKTIHALFEEQAVLTPDHIAVSAGEVSLTYRELLNRAYSLARILQDRGITPDSITAIALEPSLDFVTAVLGVLFAGGAYLPLDITAPENRISFMLSDSKAALLITSSALAKNFSCACEQFTIDDPVITKQITGGAGPFCGNALPGHLAYIIYTSGSTGQPKGTMIEHKGLVNYICWAKEFYLQGKPARFPLYSSLAFDLTVTSIFTPLISGGTIVVYNASGADKYQVLETILKERKTDVLKLTPTHLRQLMYMEKELLEKAAIRILIVGGEQLTTQLAKEITSRFGKVAIYNEYGPTETVVGCMIYRFDETQDTRVAVPIGIPSGNMKIYILDKNLSPDPYTGELYISGAQMARGYLYREALTRERFLPNPFEPGLVMYKTGDKARWLPGGVIEYTGRIDHQVKVRGYRIECEEIEQKLLSFHGMREAIVLAKEDKSGNNYLCAYYSGERELSTQELREYLQRNLPEYMVPSYFIQLEKLPLNPSGKIDRKALPEVDGRVAAGVEYEAPGDQTEETLCGIWEDVLDVERVGVQDNFFEIGGDSIKAIQVIARLGKYGLKLQVKDIFKHQKIREIAKVVTVKETTQKAYQGTVEGEVALTPIQKWFFENVSADKHHFNQSIMLYKKDGIEIEPLKKVLERIWNHHDALRMVYRETDHGFIQYNKGIGDGEASDIKVWNLRETEDVEAIITEKANEAQSSIDIHNGPLMKVVLFQTETGDRLLIIIHHLVVDGVSWRILREDMIIGYEQARKGEEIRFAEKTFSFKDWAGMQKEYAGSKEIGKEMKYWKKLESRETNPLPVDHKAEGSSEGDSEQVVVKLSAEETERLLKKTNRAYNTEINDLLLAALGKTIKEWSGEKKVLINLEGHGREEIGRSVDISRTVGWFTTCYPVFLDMEDSGNIEKILKGVKEELRRIPNKGIGYGIIKYLGNKAQMEYRLKPEINFNYLGDVGGDSEKAEMFQMSGYNNEKMISERAERLYKIDINAITAGREMFFEISYNRKEYEKQTMQKIGAEYRKNLLAITEHCEQKQGSEKTASDFGEKVLSLAEYETIWNVYKENIQKIYPLSPMQEGMLFHALMDESSSNYFEQMSIALKGKADVENFRKSFRVLVKRYDVCRTVFVSEKITEPRQVVLKEMEADFRYKDMSGLAKPEQDSALNAYKAMDKKEGFDLSRGKLIRLSLIRKTEKEYEMIWSFHHILMDGWCCGIIHRELMAIYEAEMHDKEIELPVVRPYEDYIRWLNERDREEAAGYWDRYLEGYEDAGKLPSITASKNAVEYNQEVKKVFICEEITGQLVRMAKEKKVTLSTIMQTVWGLLLQRYTNTDDVVFGKIVSGRPGEIEGIEDMIGLFINAIPVRIKNNGEKQFADLLLKVQADSVESERYFYLPLAEIQSRSGVGRDLIRYMIGFENFPAVKKINEAGAGDSTGITIGEMESFEQTNYDLNILCSQGERIDIDINYNKNVYSTSMMERLITHFENIMEAVAREPGIELDRMEMLSTEEKRQLLEDFNDTARDYPEDKTVVALFEEQAAETPDNIAVVFKDKKLTYNELNREANKVAHYLRSTYGIKGDDHVGILLQRSEKMIIAILGILKAGGAYVPVDPDYPEERIRLIIEDARFPVMIGEQTDGICISIHDILRDGDKQENPRQLIDSGNAAYVIYTSGSTGRPKGTVVRHRGLSNLMVFFKSEFNITGNDRIIQFASISFDASVWETCMALLTGASLYVLSMETINNTDAFTGYMSSQKITIATLPPTYLVTLEPHKISTLRLLFTAGSATNWQLVMDWSKYCTYINAYGPTETTICATFYEHRDVSHNYASVPIGKPITNTQIYIQDKKNRLQPVGVPGELCIAGVTLAREYWQRPDLTAEKFIANPFKPGERMYRSGDLARWLPDGNIEFLGRIDYQVKVRGYRIELGEIESQLLKHEAIREAVVVARDDSSGNKYLCAYLSAAREMSTKELQDFLIRELPNYMVPSYFVQLEKLPLNTSGKIDRKALPEGGDYLRDRDYKAPANAIEEKLCRIWEQVIGVERIGTNDNFFDLGGNSISAIKLVSCMAREGFDFKINDIFHYNTIRELAREKESRLCADELIGSDSGIKKVLEKEFGVRAEILQYQFEDTDYRILYIEDSLIREKYNALTSFIVKNVRKELNPQYIEPYPESGGIDLHHIDQHGLKVCDEKAFRDELPDMLAANKRQLRNCFSRGKVVKQFPLSAMQQRHLTLSNRTTGILVELEPYPDKEALENALGDIIREQLLLRSCVVREGGKFYWNVLDFNGFKAIPCKDISRYNPVSQKVMLKQIINRLFASRFNPGEDVLFDLLLIKENSRDCCLLFIIDHIIFDAMSAEIIKRKLHDYYRLHLEKKQIALSAAGFDEYVARINRGPKHMNEDELIKEFRLAEYAPALTDVRKLFAEGKELVEFDVNVTFDEKILKEESVWSLSFIIFMLYCKKCFGFDTIPVSMLYYGRNYEDANYSDTVGEFLDVVPLLLNAGDDPGLMMDNVQAKLKIVKEHNINFMTLVYDNVLAGKWKRTGALLKNYEKDMIRFNFQGKISEEEAVKTTTIPDIGRQEESKRTAIDPRADTDIKGLLFEAMYSGNILTISVLTVLPDDADKLEADLVNIAQEVSGC